MQDLGPITNMPLQHIGFTPSEVANYAEILPMVKTLRTVNGKSLDGFCFKIVQADRRRIHRLEVTREAVAESAE